MLLFFSGGVGGGEAVEKLRRFDGFAGFAGRFGGDVLPFWRLNSSSSAEYDDGVLLEAGPSSLKSMRSSVVMDEGLDLSGKDCLFPSLAWCSALCGVVDLEGDLE